MTPRKKLILVVIDGLTPAVFEDAVDTGAAPALSFLAEHGRYRRGVSTFPSLTPVCLSSIATGAHPDIHRIPHLVWWHRQERRLVEYGSSFAAIRAAGTRRSILDAIFNMNEQHLGGDAVTVYEALEDAGLAATGGGDPQAHNAGQGNQQRVSPYGGADPEPVGDRHGLGGTVGQAGGRGERVAVYES